MKEYQIDGPSGEQMTVQLDDDEAKARGLKPAEKKAAPAPANKARSAKNKG